MTNHPRDDISPRPTLLPGARAANHATAPQLAHPVVFVAPTNPSYLPAPWSLLSGKCRLA